MKRPYQHRQPCATLTADRLGFLPMVLVASGIAAANAYGFMPVEHNAGDEVLNIWLQARDACPQQCPLRFGIGLVHGQATERLWQVHPKLNQAQQKLERIHAATLRDHIPGVPLM